MHQPVVLSEDDALEAVLHRYAFVKAHYFRKPTDENHMRMLEVSDQIMDLYGIEVLRLAESNMCGIEVIECETKDQHSEK